jgi:hypothetical protein
VPGISIRPIDLWSGDGADHQEFSNAAALCQESRCTCEFAGAAKLLPLVYNELRPLAAHRLAEKRSCQTLQPTALVHEVWLRLTVSGNRAWLFQQLH